MPSLWESIKYRSTIDEGTTIEHLTSELGNPIVVSGVIDSDSFLAGYTADISIDVLTAEYTAESTADLIGEASAEVVFDTEADYIS